MPRRAAKSSSIWDHEGVMLLIFAALCEVRDFAACEGVCRAWRRLLPDCRPHTITASRHPPLQQLTWLAARKNLMRSLIEFSIKDNIIEEGIELSGLLDLAFKYARGLIQLWLEIPGLPKDHLGALAYTPPTLRSIMCHHGKLSSPQWAMMPKEVQLLSLMIDELNPAALDHLSVARETFARCVTKEAIVHFGTPKCTNAAHLNFPGCKLPAAGNWTGSSQLMCGEYICFKLQQQMKALRAQKAAAVVAQAKQAEEQRPLGQQLPRR